MCQPVISPRNLALCLVGALLGISTVQAHSVGDVEDLRWIGYAAPFGNDESTTYTDVWGDGDYGYIGSLESGVAIVDVSVSSQAIPLGTFVPPTPQQFYDVKAKDGYGYFSSLNGGGTFVVDTSDPNTPTSVFQIDSAIGGHDNVRNAVIGGDYLYQIDDSSAVIHVFDISQPTLPTYVRSVNTGDSVGVFDATVVGDRMYASGLGGNSGEGAVYVFDIANMATSAPTLLGQVATGANTSSAWPTYNGDYLVVTHHEVGGDLGIWDISNLGLPTLASSANASDLGLTSYSTGEVMLLDNILYVSWWEAGIQVLDLDNDLLNNGMQLIGQLDTSTAADVSSGSTVQAGIADQFERLAIGDRFFYEWDPDIAMIESLYGVFVLDSLAELMLANTDIYSSSITNADRVFFAQQPVPEPASVCLLLAGLLLSACGRPSGLN